ncbi:MAG: FtsX-like permease family protein, partial [Acidobacteriota bacterium]
PGGIVRIVFREGLSVVALGLALGVVAALGLGRVLEGQVFGVRPSDPVLLGIVAVLTGVVALLACLSPAYRAAKVDPLNVLTEQ